MDTFEHADVKLLNEVSGERCVSIFLPTHRTGTAMQQDPIRLKNLLREAERQLLAAGMRTPDAAELLKPAESLLADSTFWQYQSDGLAAFAAPGQFHSYRVPLPLNELVIVADRWQLKPLLPLLTGDGHFYILALSQNEVRLLEGTRHSVDQIALDGLPANLREALQIDELDKQLQFHTGAAPQRGGRRAAVFHGHGPGDEQTKEQLAAFFRRIDGPLCDYLGGDRAPLVLAGVEYYFPIYKSITRYSQLVGDGIAGNPELARPDQLHKRAWALVEPYFEQKLQAALGRFASTAGTGLTSSGILEILPAASQGRVEVLLVATDRQQWGAYARDSRQVQLHESSDAHNEDLLDRAAFEAYLTGAAVYALPSARIPGNEALAAIFRY